MKYIKKLVLFITLTVTIPFIAQAYNTLSYEKNCILNFAQELRLQHKATLNAIAQWLDHKAINRSYYYLESDIITIANIVNNPTLTTESKITLFDEMIQKETKEKRWQKINDAIATTAVGIMSAGALAFLIWAMIEDIKNPRPIITVRQRPGITLTFRNPGGSSWQFPWEI